MVDDDRFDEFVDVSLARDLVVALRYRHEGGAEADGQIVGVHHVFLAVLRQAGVQGKGESFKDIISFCVTHLIYTVGGADEQP